jgi:hypothetical protein
MAEDATGKKAELALIAAARGGDADAFSRLMQANQDRIYSSILRQVRDEHKALTSARKPSSRRTAPSAPTKIAPGSAPGSIASR